MKWNSSVLALALISGGAVFIACVGDVPATATDSGTPGEDGGGPLDGGVDASIDAPEGDASRVDASDAGPDAAIACATYPGPNALTPLGTGQHPNSVAVDCANVYWADPTAGKVMECAIGGCGNNPTAFQPVEANAFAVAADGTNVYWTNGAISGGSVKQARADGTGTITLLASNQRQPAVIAVDGTNVYWSNPANATIDANIVKCAIGGCGNAPTQIAAGVAYGLGVYAGTVYWTNGYSLTVERCAPGAVCFGDAGTSSPVAQGQGFTFALAVDATGVYWTNRGNGNSKVMKCALNTDCGVSGATEIANTQANPGGIALDDTFVYWTTEDGKVMKCVKAGGCGATPMLVADRQFTPGSIAVDGTSVYWGNNIADGGVMKQKPK